MIAWLYGPTGAGARSVLVVRRSIYSPFLERTAYGARENLIILRQNAAQVECDPLVDDPPDHRWVRGPKRLRDPRRSAITDCDRKRRLRLLGQRSTADRRSHLDYFGGDA